MTCSQCKYCNPSDLGNRETSVAWFCLVHAKWTIKDSTCNSFEHYIEEPPNDL